MKHRWLWISFAIAASACGGSGDGAGGAGGSSTTASSSESASSSSSASSTGTAGCLMKLDYCGDTGAECMGKCCSGTFAQGIDLENNKMGYLCK
jgi:hypothetical protein